MALWVTAAGAWIASTESVAAASVISGTSTETCGNGNILHSLTEQHTFKMGTVYTYLLLALVQSLRIKTKTKQKVKLISCDSEII